MKNGINQIKFIIYNDVKITVSNLRVDIGALINKHFNKDFWFDSNKCKQKGNYSEMIFGDKSFDFWMNWSIYSDLLHKVVFEWNGTNLHTFELFEKWLFLSVALF